MAQRIPSEGMVPFKGMDSTDAAYALEEAMAEHPKEFEGLSLSQVMPFVTDKEYLTSLMKADICSSEEKKHTWKLNNQKRTYCAGCCQRFNRGMYCSKCLTTVHVQCYNKAAPCDIKYYNENNSVAFLHVYSNVVMDGDCDVCDEPITRRRKGKICRWCALKVHMPCAAFRDQCHSPKYRHFLFPPVLRRGRRCSAPLLVFINPKAGDGHGARLMQEFLHILHPMQVIDISVTNPMVAFQRFAWVPQFNVFVIGGDKMCGYVLKAYGLIRDKLVAEPKFRFIPIGPYAEIGRSLGGNIKYSKKSAKYLIKQIPRLQTYNFLSWNACERVVFKHRQLINEDFFFTFAFGMETYMEMALKREKFWVRCMHRMIPESIRQWYNRYQVVKRWGTGPEPPVAEYISLEIDGREVDLTERPYVAVVFRNHFLREGEIRRRNTDTPDITDGTLDIYGLTEYCMLTNRNIEKKGIKLGRSNDIKVVLMQNIPHQADARCDLARYITPGDRRNVYLCPNSPLQVLGVRNQCPFPDQCLTIKNRREDEDKPLDTNECFIDELDYKLRLPELERQRREWAELEEAERIERENEIKRIARLVARQAAEQTAAARRIRGEEEEEEEEDTEIVITEEDIDRIIEHFGAEELERMREELEGNENVFNQDKLMEKRKEKRRGFLEKMALEGKKNQKEEARERKKAEEKAEAARKKTVREKIARERSAAEAEREKFLEEKIQREKRIAKDEQEAGPSKCKDEQEAGPSRFKDEQKAGPSKFKVEQEAGSSKFKDEQEAGPSKCKDEQKGGPSKCKDEKKKDDKHKAKGRKDDTDEIKKAEAKEDSEEKTTEDKKKKKGKRAVVV